MRQIVEKGMASRLRHVWHHRRPQCPESHSSLPTPVALKEFSPALFMFTTGVAIAIFVMLTENLIRKYWHIITAQKQQPIISTSEDTSEREGSVTSIIAVE